MPHEQSIPGAVEASLVGVESLAESLEEVDSMVFLVGDSTVSYMDCQEPLPGVEARMLLVVEVEEVASPDPPFQEGR